MPWKLEERKAFILHETEKVFPESLNETIFQRLVKLRGAGVEQQQKLFSYYRKKLGNLPMQPTHNLNRSPEMDNPLQFVLSASSQAQ